VAYYGDDGDNNISGGFLSYYGGEGHDFLTGGQTPSSESFYGGAGNDVILGGFYATFTGNGNSAATPLLFTAFYPSGGDFLEGSAGNDAIYGGDGNDSLFGGDGDDGGIMLSAADFYAAGLRGGDGDDFVDGGRGNDELYGERGEDVLQGGDGADRFFFTTALSAATNLDTVRDFEKGIDDIVLSQAIFTGIGPTLEKSEFYVGKKAHDASDRVGYNDKSGKMWFDADGEGGAGKVFFADLDGGLKLKFSDVLMIA